MATVFILPDARVCNEVFSLTSLIGIGDAKHFKVLQFAEVCLPFLVGVEVTAKPDRLNCGMLLDDLPFCCKPGVEMLRGDCLQIGDGGFIFKRDFEFSLELVGISLLNQEEGWFRTVAGGNARDIIPLVRELERRRIGAQVGEDSAVNDLLIPKLKRVKHIKHKVYVLNHFTESDKNLRIKIKSLECYTYLK
jgi:hypothetical protein